MRQGVKRNHRQKIHKVKKYNRKTDKKCHKNSNLRNCHAQYISKHTPDLIQSEHKEHLE